MTLDRRSASSLRLCVRRTTLLFALALAPALAGSLATGCSDGDASSLAGSRRAAADGADAGDDGEGEATFEDEAPPASGETDEGETDASVAGDGEADASDGGPIKPPRMPLLKAGLHPDASDALRVLGVKAEQIVQTIGNAQASAGTHAKDGTVNGADYSAAVDISVRGMSDAAIKKLLGDMTQYGFAGWYRKPGSDGWPADEYPHFHLIYTGAAMKLSLRNQCRAFFAHRNGLVSNTTYQYFTWSQAQRDAVKAVFLTKNPASG